MSADQESRIASELPAASAPRIEKVVLLEFVSGLFRDASFILFTTYKGLTVSQAHELRGQLAGAGAGCRVLKNSFIKLGLANAGIELPASFEFSGDTAAITGTGDSCQAAKAIAAFAKEHPVVTFKAGIVDGKFLAADRVKALAELPPMDVLYAQLLGLLKHPARRLLRVLSARSNNIVCVLQNYLKKGTTE